MIGVAGGREYRLGSPFGIPLTVQSWLVWLALAVFGFSFLSRDPLGGSWILVLFVSILLHEWGHALTARALGDRVHKVTLHLLGGVTYRSGTGGPRSDFRITAAGPAVNVVLGIGAWVTLFLYGGALPFWAFLLLAQLMWANLVLAVFNLLPIHPMDGGILTRLALARRLGGGVAARLTIGISLWTLVMVGVALVVLGMINIIAVVILLQLGMINVMEMRQVGAPSFGEARAAIGRWRVARAADRERRRTRPSVPAARGAVTGMRITPLGRDADVLEKGRPLLDRAIARGLGSLSPDERRLLILHRRLVEMRVDSAPDEPDPGDLALLAKHLEIARAERVN
jgi:Zn-dependent protease